MRKTLTTAAALATAFSSVASPAPDKQNVILIMTDQQNMNAMSCAGNLDIDTPNIDALAADGVRFTRAYTPFPVSGPCRAALFTGMYPVQIGASDNGVRPSEEALADGLGIRMRDAGYDCMYAGKWHAPEINMPESAGFRKLCDMDDRIVPEAVERGIAERDKNKPLFLVASFLDPHEICEFARDESLPYGELPAFHTEDCPNLPKNFMPSTYEAEVLRLEQTQFLKSYDTWTYTQDDWRRYIYAYYRLIERVDQRVGQIVRTLKDNGLYDNSIIIFCSDHGDGAAAHGWNQKWALFEECINVPLIIKAPGLKKGSVNESSLANIGLDIYTTACEAAGIQLPQKYEGVSLLAQAKGKAKRSSVVVETYLSGTQVRGWSVIEGKYKYTLYQYYQNREGLYDLETDKGEMQNLAIDKKYITEVERLRAQLYEWAVAKQDAKLIKQLRNVVKEAGMQTGHIKTNR